MRSIPSRLQHLIETVKNLQGKIRTLISDLEVIGEDLDYIIHLLRIEEEKEKDE